MKTIRKSFSARLSLQVVMIASMVFGVVFSVLFFSSKRIVRQEAESHAGSELSGTVYQIEDILHRGGGGKTWNGSCATASAIPTRFMP